MISHRQHMTFTRQLIRIYLVLWANVGYLPY